MENSKIEWTDHTFNPWIGCTKVSPGCAHCYAETLNKRMGWAEWGKGGKRKKTGRENWKKPLQWNHTAHLRYEKGDGKRPRVFCASLADWLDEEVPWSWRMDLYDLICATPYLDWLLLTKRPERFDAAMREMAGARTSAGWWADGREGCVPENVWVGTSVEDQKRADERIPALLDIPAKVRFLSCEPLLGPLDLSGFFGGPYVGLPGDVVVPNYNFGIDWVIVGGESGPGARPMEREWVGDLRRQCDAASVAFFFKQWGGVRKKETGRELDGRTHDAIPSVNATREPHRDES